MKRFFRYLIRIFVGLFALLALCWVVLGAYVFWNKQDLLKKARTALNQQVSGALTIGRIDFSFFHHFPNITLELSGVDLRDSLWQQHHHDLLRAGRVGLSFSLWKSLWHRNASLDKVFIEEGAIYLYTDSTGYSNTSALRRKDRGGKRAGATVPDVSLSQIRLIIEKILSADTSKLFDLDIHRLDCALSKSKNNLNMTVSTQTLVRQFAFKLEKGSFLQGKTLSGRFRLTYNEASKIIEGKGVRLLIDGHPFLLSGRFFPAVKPDPFFLTIQTNEIPYRQAIALLTPHIAQKLGRYSIDRPVSLVATLDAGSADQHTPLIMVRMTARQATVTTPAVRFDDVGFEGNFTNEWVHGQLRNDENSGIRFLSFTGKWQKIPIHADTIDITNLKTPLLSCSLQSGFALTQLNELSGSKTIQFQKGSCALKIHYTGPLSEHDTSSVFIRGQVDLDSASVEYLPHRFRLTDTKGSLRFDDQDLVVDHLETHAGKSVLSIKGVARNLVALIDRNTGDLSMAWSITSPHLDLEDLRPLLDKPAGGSPSNAKNANAEPAKTPFGTAAARVDNLLTKCSVQLKIKADELDYGDFSGQHAFADLLFDDNDVKLNRFELEQGGGSLTLSSVLKHEDDGGAGPITLQSHIDQVDLPRIFASFDNFGQDALTGKNLKGKLTADIHMTGRLDDHARLVSKSLRGTVDFLVKGGGLVDFEPIEKIHETVLKNRDFSEIRFAELKNRLDVDSTTLDIHRMEIQSTAFSLFVEGTYDLKKGADMSVQVPLSNLKNKNQAIPPDKKGNDGSAGVSVRLRVRTGDDGKLRISWDPFKKALRKKKAK